MPQSRAFPSLAWNRAAKEDVAADDDFSDIYRPRGARGTNMMIVFVLLAFKLIVAVVVGVSGACNPLDLVPINRPPPI